MNTASPQHTKKRKNFGTAASAAVLKVGAEGTRLHTHTICIQQRRRSLSPVRVLILARSICSPVIDHVRMRLGVASITKSSCL